jgi:hypothetical protein
MSMRKKLHILKHFPKSKLLLPITVILRLIPIEVPKKSIKLLPTTADAPNEAMAAHGRS